MKKTFARFDVSKADAKLIDQIVTRSLHFRVKHRLPAGDRLSVEMDITACHRNGCALDLARLLAADDANFGHDVFGISRYIDRDTGQLTDHFLSRFSRPKKKARGRTSRADARVQKFVDETNLKKMGDMMIDAVFGGR